MTIVVERGVEETPNQYPYRYNIARTHNKLFYFIHTHAANDPSSGRFHRKYYNMLVCICVCVFTQRLRRAHNMSMAMVATV